MVTLAMATPATHSISVAVWRGSGGFGVPDTLVSVKNNTFKDEKEVAVLVEHAILKEEKTFARMKKEVDQAKKFMKAESKKRAPIPSDVQRFVWQRDEGRCVECGSKERLEYDHIIPVSKGGSNTERNIQLLCETCNRTKGASI